MSYLNFKHWRGDLFGGMTAAVVALPLALAFGYQSGLGASAGLYGAILLSFFAAFFGGTQTQISGPTAPMTAVSMVVIAGIIADFEGNVEAALPIILAVFLISGLVQILMGFAGLGKLIKYIPYPVVSGFMTGIGVIILIGQTMPALGYSAKEDMAYVESFKPQAEEVILERILREEASEGILVLEDFSMTIERADEISDAAIEKEAVTLASKASSGVIGSLRSLPRAIKNINTTELLITFLTVFIIYGFKRITKAVPSTLVALIIMTGGAYALGVDYRDIGSIPEGLPVFQLGIFSHFSFGALSPYLVSAIVLALLGALDSLLTSIVADNMTRTKHESNRELVGQGIGNSISALFGGIPGAGATIRTVVNIQAGGKTRISGMMAGVVLLLILVAMGGLAEKVPAAVLAGILITVGIGVMDMRGLAAIAKTPRQDVIVMLTVLLVTSFYDLIAAVILGLVLSALIFMAEIGKLTASRAKLAPITNGGDKELIVKVIHGPLFFGATNDLIELTRKVPESAHAVVLDLHEVPYVDQSGLLAIEEMVLDLRSRDIQVVVAGLQEQPMARLRVLGIIPTLITENCWFDTLSEAKAYVADHHGVTLS